MSPSEVPSEAIASPSAEPPVLDPAVQKAEETKARAIMEVVLPLFLDAGRAVMVEAEDATTRVVHLLDVLEQNAKAAGEGEDGFWTAAVELSRSVLVERDAAMQLVERANRLDTREGFAWKTLCVLCYLGASMDAAVLPRMAVMLHMSIAEYVYRHVPHPSPLYDEFIVSWFTWYWERVFAESRFRFYTPQIVTMDLRDAVKSEPEVRIQRVLRAMAFGLWEPLPEKGRDWFENA